MKNTVIILAPEVDAAFQRLIDYVDPSDIPNVLNFLERIQTRMVHALSTYPEAGAPFQGAVRFLAVDGYTFIYEYHSDANEVHVLDLMMPGQDWR